MNRLISLSLSRHFEVPVAFADEFEARKRRFDFLFPKKTSPRHTLKSPEFPDPRWAVVSRSVGEFAWGATPEEAVDQAIDRVAEAHRLPEPSREGELFHQAEATCV